MPRPACFLVYSCSLAADVGFVNLNRQWANRHLTDALEDEPRRLRHTDIRFNFILEAS